jgi:hypothetical protein
MTTGNYYSLPHYHRHTQDRYLWYCAAEQERSSKESSEEETEGRDCSLPVREDVYNVLEGQKRHDFC